MYDDFHIWITGMSGGVKVSPMSTWDFFVFVTGKIFYLTWAIFLPLTRGNYSTLGLLGLLFLAEMFHGMVLAFMFALAHVGDEAEHIEVVDNKIHMGWAQSQLASTCDFEPCSFFWTHFSGGLNHQAVHHLFPWMIHTHYPAVSKIVARVAKKFDVEYRCYPTIFVALKGFFWQLYVMGNTE
eukprot:TRINITY_DN33470_c0_g1_i2.p1 TRINITY_DN33470_c0_g1~~TRINITY_DN33470_c0_g1_i2.p1  ORF type:complete len:211 (-),score=4.27 TRINITY_DN33470_c0_g1_i2:162-707(-)